MGLIILLLAIPTAISKSTFLIKNDWQERTIELIEKLEGFSPAPYLCEGGLLTIGFGTKAESKIQLITPEEARQKVKDYLYNITFKKIEKYNLTDNQKIALSSFDYNTNKMDKLFVDNILHCEKILKYTKVCNKEGCKELNGLVKRRKIEYDLCINNYNKD